MKCPKCGFLSFNDLDRCKQCGADWTLERAQLKMRMEARGSRAPESPRPQEAESPREPAGDHVKDSSVLRDAVDREFDRLYNRLKGKEEKKDEIRWGGFFRRSAAFSIDVVVLFGLSSLLFYFVYVAFRVGLVIHGQIVTAEHLIFFLRLFALAWICLVAGYFVLLPGMSGMTVGKWVLGLRIVATNRSPISYGQAMLRWLGYALSAPFGLGFLWILLSKEKRGWHDRLARTWVVRDWARE